MAAVTCRGALALALLPFLLALSQVGYFTSKPFHAIFGVVLGLIAGTAGFGLNVRVAQRRWSALAETAVMLVVLLGCFVAIEVITLILNAVLPPGFTNVTAVSPAARGGREPSAREEE